MDWLFIIQISFVEALPPTNSMTVFEERAFTEIIKVKWGHKSSGIISILKRRGCETRALSLSACTQRTKVTWGHSEKVAVYNPGKEPSPGTNHTGTLLLNFQSPKLWENKFLLLSHSACGILLCKLRHAGDRKNVHWDCCSPHKQMLKTKVSMLNKEKVKTSQPGPSFWHTVQIIMLLCLKTSPESLSPTGQNWSPLYG